MDDDTPNAAAAAAEAWLREAADHLLAELSLFGRTFAAFVARPGRSAQAWQAGQRTFMNPLGFGAMAASVYWALVSVLTVLWPVPGPASTGTLAEQLASAVGPYLHYGLLGLAMHFALRSLGSHRRVLGSLGIAFLTGGSVGTVAALLWSATARWIGHGRGTGSLELHPGDTASLGLFIGAMVAYAVVCLAIARSMQGLHHAAGWKVLLASMVAVLVTALLFGSVLPDGAYGWHPYFRVDLRGGFGFAFGFEA